MSVLKSSEKIQIAKEIVVLLEEKELNPDVMISILKVVVKAIRNDFDILKGIS